MLSLSLSPSHRFLISSLFEVGTCPIIDRRSMDFVWPRAGSSSRGCCRLEDLNDDLLVSIISRLPVDELVRTSILARRWRSLWTRSPHLHLEFGSKFLAGDPYRPRLNLDVLGRVLLRRVDSAHLVSCYVGRSFLAAFERKKRPSGWAQFIARLTIDCTGSPPGHVAFVQAGRLPPMPALEELHLTSCSLDGLLLPNASFLPSCIALRHLHLKKVHLGGDHSVSVIINSCPYLESLALLTCQGLSKPQIGSQVLLQMEIRHIDLKWLYIEAPALINLTMDEVGISEALVLRLPRVQNLSTTAFIIGDELQSMGAARRCCPLTLGNNWSSMIEMLELCSGLCTSSKLEELEVDKGMFSKLRSLSIAINLNDIRQVVIFGAVLHQCPILQELDISNGEVCYINVKQCLPFKHMDYWRRRDSFYDCFNSTLSYVMIRNYKGLQDLELEFVTFLILRGVMLRKLILCATNHATKELEDIRCFISSVPRASSNIEVVLNGELVEQNLL